MPCDLNIFRDFIKDKEKRSQRRELRVTRLLPNGMAERDGATLLNLSGNDYLGLSRHPALIAKAREFAEKYGNGSTASRLVCGNGEMYAEIEEKLARGKGCEAALVMGGGYQTNLSAIAALADPQLKSGGDCLSVTILADKLCHNSMLQGMALSGARTVRFRHNDCGHLESLLSRHGGGANGGKDRLIIATESVFSMDGDRAPLAEICQLAQLHSAMLYVDEAHSTGLFGPDGFGLAAAHKGQIDVVMGTFGKALGSFGSYIACAEVLRDYLIQRCGGFIYSTALPPPVLGAISAAIDLLPTLDEERERLQAMAAKTRAALRGQGWDCGNSTTQIIPVILGGEESASRLSAELARRGFLVPAIRPPTVPPSTSRLRVSLSAAHSEKAMESFVNAMEDLKAHGV